MSVIFSDFLLPNEMPWYTEHISTTIFFICVLFLSYQPVKVSRNNMAHPVCFDFLIIVTKTSLDQVSVILDSKLKS